MVIKVKQPMITQTKSNARWLELSEASRELINEWLFEERIGVREAWKKATTELGFKGSYSSLYRFYQQTTQARLVDRLLATKQTVAQVAKAKVDAAKLHETAMALVGQLLLQRLTETPEAVKKWVPLMRLMQRQEELQHRREFKEKELEIRQSKLELAQVSYHNKYFKAVSDLDIAVPNNGVRLASFSRYEHNRRMNKIRVKIYGDALRDLLPENQEEEVERLKAEQEARLEQIEKNSREWEAERAAEDREMKEKCSKPIYVSPVKPPSPPPGKPPTQ
jgi:hypothetical protein